MELLREFKSSLWEALTGLKLHLFARRGFVPRLGESVKTLVLIPRAVKFTDGIRRQFTLPLLVCQPSRLCWIPEEWQMGEIAAILDYTLDFQLIKTN